MNAITTYLPTLNVKDPMTADGVSIFPVFGSIHPGPDYMMLEDAIAAGLTSVEEKGTEGSVPVLVLNNQSDTHVLVLQGDEVVGGKQNRILNITVLVPPKSSVDLPVSCVEQGRWRHVSNHFRAGDKAFLKLRRELSQQVTSHRRDTGMPMSDQSGVWSSVDDELRATGVGSSTHAMRDAYDQKRRSLAALEARLPYVEGAIGLICAIQGRPAFAEIFDRREACQRAWPRLVRSVAFDIAGSTDEAVHLSAETVCELFADAEVATIDEYANPGLGTDLRLSGPRLTGSALAVGDSLIHCSLFSTGLPTHPDPSDPPRWLHSFRI